VIASVCGCHLLIVFDMAIAHVAALKYTDQPNTLIFYGAGCVPKLVLESWSFYDTQNPHG
jgi:hypothetical protein